MTFNHSAVLLALFGGSLVLITLSLRLLRGTAPAGETYSSPARFFLIALRLAIGWHCFVEGMEKLSTPNWSSEAYLRESMGPFSGVFKSIAGDRLIDKLTVHDETFPDQLDRDWRNYVNTFAARYDLEGDKLARTAQILDQCEKNTLTYLLSKKEEMTKISAYPPALNIPMTMRERLEEHERLLDKVRAAEAKFPSSNKDVLAEWKAAKADLAKWRGELKKSLDGETAKLKKALEDVLSAEQKALGPMPEPTQLPMSEWRELEWSDALVKWSLVVLGSCLLLGLFSRCSSFATALLILSFYAAMPPLPGWPESPRLEGHYVFINKTLIEVLALLALSFIPTGRWAGLDGLVGLLCPCGSKQQTPAQS